VQLQLGVELDREHLKGDETSAANVASIDIAGGKSNVAAPHAAGHRRRACPAQCTGTVLGPVSEACNNDGGTDRSSRRQTKLGFSCAFGRLDHGDGASERRRSGRDCMQAVPGGAKEGGNGVAGRRGRARGAADWLGRSENRGRLEREGVNGHASMYPS